MISKEIYKSFDRKNILITGGTGMIGRQIGNLLTKNTSAYVVSVSLDRLKLNDKVQYRYGDLSDFRGFYDLLKKEKVHFIFHCAGIKGSPVVTKEKPASFFVPLMQMNTNVLEAARMYGIKKLVYTSSIGAYSATFTDLNGKEVFANVFYENCSRMYDQPMDSFPGWAKRMGELQIKAYKIQYGLNYSIVRLGNVYGIGDNFDAAFAMVIPSLMNKIRMFKFGLIEYSKGAEISGGRKPIKILGDGSAIRDFIYSKDIAEGIILALYHGTGNGFYNLGSGEEISIKELVNTLEDIIGFKYKYIEEGSGYSKRVLDITLAREKLGFKPKTSLKEGLERTWNWFMENQTEYLQCKNYFK